MSRFIQLHLLTAYPPANLNRDDQGSPKTAKMGGYDRLRVSSQCLKRTWRTSEIFEKIVSDGEKVSLFETNIPANTGTRSKSFSMEWVKPYLLKQNIEEVVAEKWSKDLCRTFGAMENDENKLSQLTQISDIEAKGFESLVNEIVRLLVENKQTEFTNELVDLIEKRDQKKKSDDIKKANVAITKYLADKVLTEGKSSVDIAMFGRMLASSPAFNIEAACQVAHAISVHPVVIEDDYFTAVDDLNNGLEDMGAAHIGETRFAAGLFYSYICINRKLLVKNLDGNEDLANKAIRALTEAAVKVAPEGKQNSFASRAYASYVLAERGDQQPRSLSIAYLKPISNRENEDFIADSITAIIKQKDSFDKVYGACADTRCELNVPKEQGTLAELLDFVGQ
ncbi:MAG: type I-E CRISPR-associated protein Cas7/Cse4/CasC [Methylobacter sp.]|nr:type I-E CRISPR-associated protein Cas7/Cse4/CasC [Methylobacter sp.]